jgi:hypothetical protein
MMKSVKDKASKGMAEEMIKMFTPMLAAMGLGKEQGQKIMDVIHKIDETQIRTQNIENILTELCKKNSITVREDAPQVPPK